MPTRALGDLRLKKAEFNQHNFPPDLGYRKPIPQYNGPYIGNEPDVQTFDLSKDDQWLVLASDGLWDEIDRKDAAELIKGNDKDQKQLAETLFNAALDKVSKEKCKNNEFS